MHKGITKTLTAVLALSTITPVSQAVANSEMVIGQYEDSIAEAKSNMVSNPAVALDSARRAQSLVVSNDSENTKSKLIASWLEGEALMRLNRSDEAAGTIEKALQVAKADYAEDKIYADLLRSAGSSKARSGDLKAALAHFKLASERYAALGQVRSQAIVLQNIGSLYSQAGKFEQVLEYYSRAADVFSDDAILSLSANNNMGNALRGLGRYEEAEEKYAAALEIARKMESPLLQARVLTNVASSQVLRGALTEAEATANQAMALAQEHAADWKPFIYGVMARIELRRGNLAKADEYIGQTFANQQIEATNILFLDFHETASEIYAQAGRAELADKHAAATDRLKRESDKLAI